MPPLCDPPPGLPDQEEPRRLLAGRRPPPLSPLTRRYKPRSNKVTTKGGVTRFTHTPGALWGGWEGGGGGLIMQPTGNKTHRELKKNKKPRNITGGSCCCFLGQSVFKGLFCCFCWNFSWSSNLWLQLCILSPHFQKCFYPRKTDWAFCVIISTIEYF